MNECVDGWVDGCVYECMRRSTGDCILMLNCYKKNKREITHNIKERGVTIQGHKQDINIVKLVKYKTRWEN